MERVLAKSQSRTGDGLAAPTPARFLGLWGRFPSLTLGIVFVSHGSGLMEAEWTVEGLKVFSIRIQFLGLPNSKVN